MRSPVALKSAFAIAGRIGGKAGSPRSVGGLLVSLVGEIFRRAVQIRDDFPSVKTPDAIHLAMTLHYDCDEFWTRNDRLAKAAPTVAKNILTA